ncbi:hypothetical protein [uncultured Tolumonas sp.]|uniref:hypothetical protein n=1 Tax=uncultured Tolumonas sp. TaxID=263765 RepID=UPI00292E160F|nr:hypothetical protein [uncultured Tolumonas sp.]
MTESLLTFSENKFDGLEFCSKVYSLFEAIKSSPNGPTRLLMLSSRLEKKLLEELMPICKYVQSSYRPGRYISVQWVDGSQTYDAKIFQKGELVSQNYYPENAHIEITCIKHPKEYLARELLNEKGIAFGLDGISRLKDRSIESVPFSYSNVEFISLYSQLIITQITKKSTKPYPIDSILIVQCDLNNLYMRNEWFALMEQVQENLPKTSFLEIYLYDPVCHYTHSIYPENNA